MKIALADVESMSRLIIKEKLLKIDCLEIAFETNDPLKIVEYARTHHPDLIMMDVNMPEIKGLFASQLIKQNNPEIKILCISNFFFNEYRTKLRELNADGFVYKNCSLSHLETAINKILEGEFFIDDKANSKNYLSETSETSETIKKLSVKEKKFLQLLFEDKCMREISEALFISEPTAYKMRGNLKKYFNVKQTGGLIGAAVNAGYISFTLEPVLEETIEEV